MPGAFLFCIALNRYRYTLVLKLTMPLALTEKIMENIKHSRKSQDRAYDARLRCHWLCVTALSAQALRIEVVNANHCDHAGAVEFAKAVMPGVREVVIRDAGKECAALRVRDSNWSAT